jgi:hypothetical protein
MVVNRQLITREVTLTPRLPVPPRVMNPPELRLVLDTVSVPAAPAWEMLLPDCIDVLPMLQLPVEAADELTEEANTSEDETFIDPEPQ